jgi:hypothetical protein
MHTNLAGEISDRFCEAGDKIYTNILSERVFTDTEIMQAIVDTKEIALPLKKDTTREAAEEKSVTKESEATLPKGVFVETKDERKRGEPQTRSRH